MKIIIFNKDNKPRLNNILDWLIYMIGYALILLIVSRMFTTVYVDVSYYGVYGLLASVIIYLLNKTIKPILFYLTIPITGLTMGLFYPCLNVLILKLTDFILGPHFETHGIITLFFTAILISLMNVLLDELIIKPILKRSDNK